MNTLHRISATFLLMVCAIVALAGEVNVTITPKRTILPPQVMLYLSNPGQYFNVSVQNPDNEPVVIFFGAEIHQLMPTRAIDIVVPAKTMPKQGIVVPAMQTRVLDAVQLRTLFNHVRQTDVEMPKGLFDNVTSGAFGMLEEGTYEIVLNAYKWDPTLSSPVLLSNPTLSRCTFTVCYQASAPKWVSPVSMNDYEDHSIATLSMQTPMLQWTTPVVNCNPTPILYTYDLKVVQMLPLQAPDEAIERNPVVYQSNSLAASQCLIPTTIISKFSPSETYVAQITTRSNSTQVGALDFVNLQNDGKSDLLMFRVKDYTQVGTPDKTPEDDDDDDYNVWLKGHGGKDSLSTDSMYVFRNPVITAPSFTFGAARKVFVDNDIDAAWNEVKYMGGEGVRPDTLKFNYEVQLFANGTNADRKEALKGEPFYTKTIKSGEELQDSIPWEIIKEKVENGSYMLMRVKPVCLNETSIEYRDSGNIVDFALTDYLSHYFQCSNGMEVSNTNPTSLSAADLKGKTVTVGEYELVLDGTRLEAVKGKTGHFKGTGHVIWEPMKFTWKLAVKFDDIAINTDNEVYEGLVETFEGDKPEETKINGAEIVDNLFSDWGIDNLIADTGIPYADKLQDKIDGKVASLADELASKYGDKLASYYNDVKKKANKFKALLSGDFEDVTFPLRIPDNINPTPVDLQISKMKFAPTYATMDFFGTFVVPETEATRNQILVFGAPRICISPSSLIPDGTTIALLKDFTINDPSTSYDCTFKAPEDVMAPMDGCFVAWNDGEFRALRLDLDMTLPNLKKVDDKGKATDQNPQLHITADVKAPITANGQKLAGWDWMATADLDPFEHEDLPGYTFHAADKVVIDHSSRENAEGMPGFPKDYDLKLVDLEGKKVTEWMGVYIGELSMEMPKDIKIGNGDERMKVALSKMLIDNSGMTVEAGIVNAINYSAGEEGSIGGFAISLDTISVNFIQNQHKDFRFTGKLNIPLFKGTVNYACNIYNQKFTGKGTKEGYAYVFKTWQMEGLNFDFMLGDLKLNKDLTYFLVEALPDENGDLQTNCELLLGGEVTIAGTETANEFIKSKLSKLPMDLTLPEIKFCKLRLANNKSFESTYEREMQTRAADATDKMQGEVGGKGKWWNEAKDIELCDGKLFLNFGQWGYASPQKKIGPFTFALTKYDFDLSGELLTFTLGGGITFCDELKITADAAVNIQAKVKNLSLKTISDIELEYQDVKLSEVSLGVEVTGLALKGTLRTSDNAADKGYAGDLTINVGGGLFELQAHGGYFDHRETTGGKEERFAWGYFIAKAGGKFGIPMPPIQLQSLMGGFYINCGFSGTKSDGKPDYTNVKANKGAIGLAFGLGLATADGATMKGNFEMAVCMLKNPKTKSYYLSTFNMTGDVTCLEGVINSRMTIVYENNDMNRYFQLNITVDASADGMAKEIAGDITEVTSKLKEESDALQDKIEALTGKAQEVVSGATGGLSETLADKNEDKSGKSADKGKKTDEDESVRAKAGASVSLDLRIQTKKDGRQLDHVLWHVYLGQPDMDKRCNFTLIDFKSKIVTVSIGANAYLCLGSELPNNGQLPELPAKVKAFLDGGSHGAAKSDNMSDANKARQRTIDAVKAALNSSTGGGVMLGAQVWGYIDLDLGLFFGSMGATAGFDVSITKLNTISTCVNLGAGTPGYHHWYGQGQLYAYLYAAFGFKINLGFFKKKITLADAGIGGVLKAAMPNPNYFEGKARCAIKLLNGLVKIDKTFKFTAGQKCDLFLGNALDDYKLFEDSNLGSDSIGDIDANKISWQLGEKPYVKTQASLYSEIRVMDPTMQNKIANSSKGDGIEDFNDFASRMFRFSMPRGKEPRLVEYATLADLKANRNGRMSYLDYTVKDQKIFFDLTMLNANKYYKLVVNGKAEEYSGKKGWKDPETWDSIKGKYVNTPWSQEKVYYFATDNTVQTMTNITDLEKYTRVAFPMATSSITEGRPVLKSKTVIREVPKCDVIRPMVSLSSKTPLSSLGLPTTGKLYWTILSGEHLPQDNVVISENGYYTGASWKRDNKWICNDSVTILTPETDFPANGIQAGGTYTIKLNFEWTETTNTLGEWKPKRTYKVYSNNGVGKVRKNAMMALRRSRGQYRVEVARTEMLNANDDGSNIEYTVTVYQFEKGTKTLTYTKELLSLPVNVTTYTNADDYIDTYCMSEKSVYWANYLGIRVNYIQLNDGISNASNHIAMSYKTDIDLLGGENGNDKTKFLTTSRKGKTMPVVFKDPIAYLSYLSNVYFIGGLKINSNYIDLLVEPTSKALTLKTPFFTDAQERGKINGNAAYKYQIYNGYSSWKEAALIGPWAYKGVNYPLPSLGDERLAMASSQTAPYVQKRIRDYRAQILNLYEVCANLNDYLHNTLRPKLDWGSKSWKSWMSTHKSPSSWSTTEGDKAKGTQYTLSVPYYQLAIVTHCKWGKGGLKGIVKNLPGSKYWRFYDSHEYMSRRMNDQTTNNGFDAYKALGFIDGINYTRYRVNAWNYRKLQFTVYKGTEANTPNDFFLKTATDSTTPSSKD